MTKEEIIAKLLAIREDAVYRAIAEHDNDPRFSGWQYETGRENGICEVLNDLIDAGDLTREVAVAAFERGRDRGWAKRQEIQTDR